MDDLYISHHGILGQKWGVRRYQNPDGTWTEAGKKRYGDDIKKAEDKRRESIRTKGRANFNAVSRNVHNAKREIFEKELRRTKEYKEYGKAQEALEKAEIRNNHTFDKEHDRLVKDADKKSDAYHKKINEVYKKHESEILSARLKDLKLPDNEQWQSFYKQYHQQKVTDLGYSPDSYLQLFID